MHTTLTEHARCVFGDEYRPAPPCDREHDEGSFVELLTFADAGEILAMLRELCPQLADGYLPVRIRNLAYGLLLLQRPEDPGLTREAALSLHLHGPDWDGIAAELHARADALEAAEHRPGPE
ncbi:hypothetical protein [Streptomyces sp. bgisy060]|uniref:hypothetical protein n=1 Tax=Streptomyces sp. bgisy060 TaxID=3413775 RepID=UPI003EC10119